MLPRPLQRPHPPIWVGGNSTRAIRRAVELADGWSPMPNPSRGSRRRRTPALESIDDLSRLVGVATRHAEQVGRSEPLEVVFMPMGADMYSNTLPEPEAVVSNVAVLAEAGVTYLTMTVPGETRSELLDNVKRFGEESMPGIAAI